MPAEIALPFEENRIAIGDLRTLPFDERLTNVAVESGGAYVSINYDELQAGDIVLVSSGKFDRIILKAIVRYQNIVFKDPSIARWTHVGIMDDSLHMWDAMPSAAIRSQPLRELLLPLSRICVVRSKHPIDLNELRDSLMTLSTSSTYPRFNIDFGSGLMSRLRARTSDERVSRALSKGHVICSEFVSAVLWRSTKHRFFADLPIVLPGDFINNDAFTVVPLSFCRIEPPQRAGSLPVQASI